MEFLRLLRSESGRDTAYLLVVGGFSGLLGTLLVALIIAAAQKVAPGQLDALDLAKFAFCLACYILGRGYSLVQASALAERIVTKMRLRILDRIRHSDLLRLELVGTARVYSVLQESAATLSSSASSIVSGFSSAVMLVFATFYVAYLSFPAFVMTFSVILAGFLLFANTRKSLEKQLKLSSKKETEFFGLMQHLLDGFKEVKMNRARSEDLYGNYLVTTAEELRTLKLDADRQFAWMSLIGQNFLYVLVAFMIFVLPAFGAADAQKVGQLATAIIFIMGPLGEVVGSVPLLMRSNTAISNINELESMLDSTSLKGMVADRSRETTFRSFHEISLRNVAFAYEHRLGDGTFRLGPLDLSVNSNELLFIVGGNGSGKSTLLKVLTGLYTPETGSTLLDGEIVSREDLPVYRSLFSIIFTDFHLFDRLYGLQNIDQHVVDDLLAAMRLRNVVRIEDGRFESTDLSTGQKKRLALIVALLEQRPILVFDEVAADQDPGFRRYFYEVLLPRLQSEGRTIVAVTHDDHYFHVADRVLKMEDGKFVESTA
jgi:putative pyoverdin transport system ATP-binding/permease protein